MDRAEYIEQPADLAYKMRYLNHVYRAMKGYVQAGKQGQTVAWSKQNPDAWDTVTRIIKMRWEQKESGG